MLRRQQIIVTAITEKGKEFALPKFGGGVSKKDLAIFTRQFSVMIDAGLPLVQCLEILGSQQTNRRCRRSSSGPPGRRVWLLARRPLRKHPKVFDELFCNMIAAGEAGGILDTILQRLSTYIEKIVKLQVRRPIRPHLPHRRPRHRRRSSCGSFSTFVIPVFATLYEGLGVALPAADPDHHRALQVPWHVLVGDPRRHHRRRLRSLPLQEDSTAGCA